ncbi:MAG: sugar phosphate isomerase/epimerase [Armatimonadetes bacterium]|nr:sugar phosphate isomerase/epimerase [Armatimonadota bacterium]
MKIALQLGLIPGSSVSDKAKWAKDHGVEGIELGVFGVSNEKLRQQADEINGVLPICSVCANATPEGTASFDFLHPEKTKRRASIDGSKEVLKFCGEVGAVGQIVPPIFGPAVVPDLSPVISVAELEEQLMLAACQELGPYAAENKTLFMLEPLNRYEQHYLRKQSDGMRIIDAAQVPGIGLLSDFFHMHIEETSSPNAFRNAKGYTTSIHLADNTRQEPGTGDIDFVSSFKVLLENGYNGFMAYECGISGDSSEEKAENLAKSLDYVRDCIAKAKSL